LDGVKALRISYRLRQNGLEGKGETLTELISGRTVTRFRLGPLTGAEGFDGRHMWVQDASGLVTIPEGGDRRLQAVSAQYRQALGFWYPARAARARVNMRIQLFRMRIKEALEIAPEGGLPFELWFDAQTKLLDRVIEDCANETRTTIYEDYRGVGGVMVAHRIRSSNAVATFGAERIVTGVELNPNYGEADFDVPADPAPDFVFDGRVQTVTLPFRLLNNHIYVDAKLNGRVFPLLVDTGAANVITPTVTRALGLPSAGDARVRGAGEETERVAFTRVSVLSLGGVRLRNQLFSIVPLEKLRDIEGVPFHGLIGYELFKRFVVRIDYDLKTLTLFDAKTWEPDGTGIAVPFVFNGTVPEVEGSIDGIAASFDIDTGSRASVGLNSPFVQKHALRAALRPSIDAVTGWGLGGPTRGTVARAKRLMLGKFAVDDVVVDMSVQRLGATGQTSPAGNIGSGLLKRYVVTFDYAKQRIFLAPHARTAVREGYDRSGLWINGDRKGFRVDAVVAGSPAALAGMRDGDIIVGVDGVRALSLGLSDVRDRLRDGEPGSLVSLSVLSGRVTRVVMLKLRDLI
ncbi:MAG: aspartyl protease family protein, partial [Alphaproteobacteria bacterium]|nr:aspartyl protease family protein [Alphaproteobacteria bacterium]